MRQVGAGEGERVGQVGLAVGPAGPGGSHLDRDRTGEAALGQRREQPAARLAAPAGHQVLVATLAGAVAQMHVGQPLAHRVGHRERVVARPHSATGPACTPSKSPLVGSYPGAYGTNSRPAIWTGYMFSTAKDRSVRGGQVRDTLDEPAGVLTLPRERRMHHDAGAPSCSASSAERRSRSHGSGLHTRWVTSRHGACTEPTGTP